MEKLTEQEMIALRGLAEACHEELKRGIPPKNAVKQCNKCKKRVNFTATCPKYPERIPDKVLTGEDCPEFEPKEPEK